LYQGGAPNYFPNSFGGPEDDKKYEEHKLEVSGECHRWETKDDDNYSQAATFYEKVLSDDEKERLADNIAEHASNAQSFLQVKNLFGI
jgi:catalase